jgi:hypothetical protein
MKSLSMNTMSGPSKILDKKWKEKEAAIHRRKIS